MAEHMGGRNFIPPMGPPGYERLLAPDRNPFPTKDGFIAMLPYSTTHWRKFFESVGRADLATADWVCDPTQRSARIGELYRTIAEITPSKTTDEWLALLTKLDVPCAPVNSLDALFDEPHLAAVDYFQPTTHPTEGELLSARSPFRVAGETPEADMPVPNLGESTGEILASAGYTAADIESLRTRKIVR